MAAPYVPAARDRALVRVLAAGGTPQELIAQAVGCSPPTLRRAFRDELDKAAHEANARVTRSLLEAASAAVEYRDVLDAQGNPTGERVVTSVRAAGVQAAIWWSQARMGWRKPGDGEPDANDRAQRNRPFLLPVTETL